MPKFCAKNVFLGRPKPPTITAKGSNLTNTSLNRQSLLFQNNAEHVNKSPLRNSVKRMVPGLYGECFDPSDGGHFTYKKNKSSLPRDDSPVRCVMPGFNDTSPPPSSRTLSMFQNKPSPHFGHITSQSISK